MAARVREANVSGTASAGTDSGTAIFPFSETFAPGGHRAAADPPAASATTIPGRPDPGPGSCLRETPIRHSLSLPSPTRARNGAGFSFPSEKTETAPLNTRPGIRFSDDAPSYLPVVFSLAASRRTQGPADGPSLRGTALTSVNGVLRFVASLGNYARRHRFQRPFVTPRNHFAPQSS